MSDDAERVFSSYVCAKTVMIISNGGCASPAMLVAILKLMHLNAAHFWCVCAPSDAWLVGSRATQTVSCDLALLTLKYTRPRVEFHLAKANNEESEQRGRSIMTNVVFVCVMDVTFYPRAFVESDKIREAELSFSFTFETLAKSLRASGDFSHEGEVTLPK